MKGAFGSRVAISSIPQVTRNWVRVTNIIVEVPSFRQREQWHCPMPPGVPVMVNAMAPQTQLPLSSIVVTFPNCDC